MNKALKVILIIGVCIVLLVVAGGGAGIYWWKRHGPELMNAGNKANTMGLTSTRKSESEGLRGRTPL